MNKRFSAQELHEIRNVIPIRFLIEDVLEIPSKEVEGIFRFVCPCCHEFQTAVNPQTNLSRCFRCCRNFNTIEILMEDRKESFVSAVKTLRPYLTGQAARASIAL